MSRGALKSRYPLFYIQDSMAVARSWCSRIFVTVANVCAFFSVGYVSAISEGIHSFWRRAKLETRTCSKFTKAYLVFPAPLFAEPYCLFGGAEAQAHVRHRVGSARPSHERVGPAFLSSERESKSVRKQTKNTQQKQQQQQHPQQ